MSEACDNPNPSPAMLKITKSPKPSPKAYSSYSQALKEHPQPCDPGKSTCDLSCGVSHDTLAPNWPHSQACDQVQAKPCDVSHVVLNTT